MRKADVNIEHSINEDASKLAVSKLNHRLDVIFEGGGKKKTEKLHRIGKMTTRERIAYLADRDSDFLEIGAFAGVSTSL